MVEIGSPTDSIAITGATGFVGSHLVQALTGKGETVRCVALRPANAASGASCLDERARTMLRGCTAVVHLAGRAHVLEDGRNDHLELYLRINRDLTLDLARAAVAQGVRRMVFLSSIHVNGGVSNRPFTARDMPAPTEPYAISKWEAEIGLRRVAEELPLDVVVIRPPLIYGPGVKANFLRLLHVAASGIPLPLASLGGRRSFLSIWNLCDLIECCLQHPEAAGQTLLAADSDDIALPDLLQILADRMQRPCRLFPFPPALLRLATQLGGAGPAFDKLSASLQVDGSETRRVLNWTPPLLLAEGLSRTARWYAETHLKGVSKL